LGEREQRHGRQAREGTVRSGREATIEKSLAGLKDFNQYVVMTPGNAGTLDMLNRGEIAMGPVWVDMFYTWMADGKMNPKVKLSLPSPGLPGQPMYYVIPAKAANAAMAKKFIDFAESPEVQADGIVKQFNWYPGIDPQYVQSKMEPAAWNKLFTDISPADLSKNGRPFPLSQYFTDYRRRLRTRRAEVGAMAITNDARNGTVRQGADPAPVGGSAAAQPQAWGARPPAGRRSPSCFRRSSLSAFSSSSRCCCRPSARFVRPMAPSRSRISTSRSISTVAT
jgi:ABC-type glycerol-3-phosphate transport system substrate-binding protein